jgi:membrane-bound lytic murein transglycosylase D
MRKIRLAVSLCAWCAMSLVLGCSWAPSDHASDFSAPNRNAETAETNDLELQNYTPEFFQARFDSLVALYEFGDYVDFMTALDSLRAVMSAYNESLPPESREGNVADLLHELDKLDSLAIAVDYEHEYLSEVDSLALSLEAWPDGAALAEGSTVSAMNDTLFPYIEDERIDFWIQYYKGPGRERFERSLARMALHLSTVESILDELGMPKPLICVPLIESGFQMHATSRAKAVGPWQFISGTARLYGLRVNWWLDERRDIVASTYAASNYLHDLRDIWDSWFLALAAYNCGEYRVAQATVREKTQDFWRLRLPRQTELYVPKFLATLYILRNPQKYGFTMPEIQPLEFDVVTVTDATDLKLIAELAETDLNILKELNPALLRYCTPPHTELAVKVPKGKGELCSQRLAEIPPDKRITWRQHQLKRGETLSQVARTYGTTVETLQRLNGIKNCRRIPAGKILMVPAQGGYVELASSKPSYRDTRRNIDKDRLESYAKRSGVPAGSRRLIYKVKKHDTLSEIAEAHHTSAKKLRLWNNLYYRSYIYPGQKLVIYVPEAYAASDAENTAPPLPSKDLYLTTVYTVKKGDTFYGIARKHNVKVGQLLAWNKKNPRDKIYPGDKLEIRRAKN